MAWAAVFLKWMCSSVRVLRFVFVCYALAGCFKYCLPDFLDCYRSEALVYFAVGWCAVCECGISGSYSFTFCLWAEVCLDIK